MESSILEPVTSAKIHRDPPKRNMPQYGIRCATGPKNKCHEIIHHRTCDIPESPQISSETENMPQYGIEMYDRSEIR